MECVLQGVIQTKFVGALRELLQGLTGAPLEQIRTHLLLLTTSPNVGAVSSQLQLLCDLAGPSPKWTLRHEGGAMRGAGAEQLPVLVRPVVATPVTPNALPFFAALGFALNYEALLSGFRFAFHRGARMEVRVTSVGRLPELHATGDAEPLTPGLHLVEVVAPATAENYADVSAAMVVVAEHLSPLLRLSKPGVPTGLVDSAATAAATLGVPEEAEAAPDPKP